VPIRGFTKEVRGWERDGREERPRKRKVK